jgi:hypothetical protein
MVNLFVAYQITGVINVPEESILGKLLQNVSHIIWDQHVCREGKNPTEIISVQMLHLMNAIQVVPQRTVSPN